MKLKKYIAIAACSLLLFSCNSKPAETTEAPSEKVSEDIAVFFTNLNDGDTITSPFVVEMGVKGMEVDTAGAVVNNKGHHHILIGKRFVELGTVVPADSVSIHFGKAQTSTELTLDPGDYQLSLQFADGFHQSYGEGMSTTINVVVADKGN